MANLNQNTSRENALIFLHIPKAAGSTLHNIIARQYTTNEIFTIDGLRVHEYIDKFKNLPEVDRQEIKVLKGHMAFGLHEFLPRPSTYITILRDPIDRIISHYYYVLRRPEHYLYNQVKLENINLQEYVSRGLSPELNNGQVRLLAGAESIEFGKCDSHVLETAKNNLKQHFAVVGLSEKFDETLLLLQKTFGWGIPFYIKENVTKNRQTKESISAETLKSLKKHNELDLEIYKYAQGLFNQQLQERLGSFEVTLNIFKLMNKQYGLINSVSQPISRKIKALIKK